ncbi:DEAD/DEAH box helicase [Staphylococcus epidermidis]|uniref:DEAD/DEAH box helicase n=2 Tax=Bacillati TaxID=1783272 RepID=UPI00138E2436
MKINFSEPNTKNIAINLYKRFLETNNKYQTLTMSTGFGKTAIAVATAGIFAVAQKKDINVFIIAKKRKLEDGSWEETIRQYNNIAKYKLNIIAQTTPQSLNKADKNDKLRKKDIKAMRPSRQKELNFLSEWKKEAEKGKTIVLVDEVQLFKNPVGKQAKSLMKLLKSSTIGIGLSATPMPNGVLDDGVAYLIYNEFYKNQAEFNRVHIPPKMYDKYYKPDVFTKDHKIDPNRFNDLDLFLNRVKQTTFVPDVVVDFNIPNQEVHTLPYDLEQKSINEIYLMSKHYKERRYDSYMQYLSDIKNVISKDSEHVNKMIEVLKNNPNQQPLIFYERNTQLEGILEGLNKIGMNYKIVNGRADSNKLEDIDDTNKNQAIVIQYKSGGDSIEFQQSYLTIFYGLVYSWGDIKQAMGRNIRRGMSKDIDVKQYFLLATHSHDAKIYDVIERKKEFSEELLEELAEDIAEEILYRN